MQRQTYQSSAVYVFIATTKSAVSQRAMELMTRRIGTVADTLRVAYSLQKTASCDDHRRVYQDDGKQVSSVWGMMLQGRSLSRITLNVQYGTTASLLRTSSLAEDPPYREPGKIFPGHKRNIC